MKKLLKLSMFLALAAFGSFIYSCAAEEETGLAITHSAETVSTAAAWSGSHVVDGWLTVNAALTLQPCATIKLNPGAYITVNNNGSIKSLGTASCPVVFTSSKPAPAAGDWKYVDIQETSSNDNQFTYTRFEFGGADYPMLYVGAGAKAALNDVTFQNSATAGFQFIEGSTIAAFAGVAVKNCDKYLGIVSPDHFKSLTPLTLDPLNNKTVLVSGHSTVTSKGAGTWAYLGAPISLGDGAGSWLTVTAEITIAAGNTLLMQSGSYIEVKDGGSIQTAGTELKPVTFTSAKTSPAKGDWKYVDIQGTSSNNNQFAYTKFEFGGSDYGMLYVSENAKVGLDHFTAENSATFGIQFADGAKIASFSNVAVKNCDKFLLAASPDLFKQLTPLVLDPANSTPILVNAHTTLTSAGSGTWANLGAPIAIGGDTGSWITINGSLTVAAGNTLLMYPDSYMEVADGGSLILDGKATAKVTVKSSKTSPSAGDWRYIGIAGTAGADNRFSYTDVMHGGSDANVGQLYLYDDAKITLDNVNFTDGKDCDVYKPENATLNAADSVYNLCQI